MRRSCQSPSVYSARTTALIPAGLAGHGLPLATRLWGARSVRFCRPEHAGHRWRRGAFGNPLPSGRPARSTTNVVELRPIRLEISCRRWRVCSMANRAANPMLFLRAQTVSEQLQGPVMQRISSPLRCRPGGREHLLRRIGRRRYRNGIPTPDRGRRERRHHDRKRTAGRRYPRLSADAEHGLAEYSAWRGAARPGGP